MKVQPESEWDLDEKKIIIKKGNNEHWILFVNTLASGIASRNITKVK